MFTRVLSYLEIIGLADTMPFFAEKRLILMEDSGFFKGGAGADELTEYMGGIPESTCLVFVESEVDKRSRLYKAVKGISGWEATPAYRGMVVGSISFTITT